MKILALEFSSPQRSVAVVDDGQAPALAEVIETGGRGANALGMVEAALRQARLEREQVDCLAIGIGPGSYTGIRSIIALAQGWQLATQVNLLPISSADCIAAQARAEGLTGPVAVVIDAQRKELYLANYDLLPDAWRATEPLRLVSLDQARAQADAGRLLVGPEVSRWFPDGRVIFPRASALGRLAVGRSDFLPGHQIEPIYLRPTTFVKAPPPRPVP
jgi:tRNA threonylcarbamoyl adenosine modification protein YeaZ